MNDRDQLIKPLANVLTQIYKNVSRCKNCGSLKSTLVGCDNCENLKKKFKSLLEGRQWFDASPHSELWWQKASREIKH